MKKYLLIAALFMASQGYCKAIPGPSVLFSISDKIIAQAQDFFNFSLPEKDVPKIIKTKAATKIKAKTTVKNVELSAPKAVQKPITRVYRDGMWIVTE
jgi:hypothetical protein